jgi:hypothetical protein
MIADDHPIRVNARATPTAMRKSFDTLAALLARDMGRGAVNGRSSVSGTVTGQSTDPRAAGLLTIGALSRASCASALEQRLQRRRRSRVHGDRFLFEPQPAARKLSYESRTLGEIEVLGPHAR